MRKYEIIPRRPLVLKARVNEIQMAFDEVRNLIKLRPIMREVGSGEIVYIIDAFTWDATPQGGDYWSNANQLVKIRVIEEINYLHEPKPRGIAICQE